VEDATLRTLAEQRGLLIGAAFNPDAFGKDEAYGRTLSREFNCLVAENLMKCAALEPALGHFAFGAADGMLDFALAHGMQVRGHTLVWHNALPPWVRESGLNRRDAQEALHNHIAAVMEHFRGRVFAWDVVNEGLSDSGPGLREDAPWHQLMGPAYIERAFHWAHEADPDTQLFYNDYGMDGLTAKADRCYLWLKDMVGRGVPVHGVGLQYHTKLEEAPDPAAVAANIRRFNELGLAVHITELDVWIKGDPTPEALRAQAEVYAGVLRAALDAHDCPAVLLWGLTDRHSWVPSFTNNEYGAARPFDGVYKAKPAHRAMCEVLKRG
jgi:endo-1,4-beta-xylanase